MTSFLVYPLPSIADESFLQLIFQGKVTRSLFAGFGKRRFALVEIANDNRFAEKICDAINSHNTHKEERQEIDIKKHELCEEHNGLANWICTNMVSGKETLLHSWLSEVHGEENVTLAELYNEPTLADILNEEDASTPQKRSNSRKGKETNTVNNNYACKGDNMNLAEFVNEHHLEYLNHLFWRGQPVHVVESHVELNEFFRCGGVVPQHNLRLNKKSIINSKNKNKVNDENHKGKENKSKHEHDINGNKTTYSTHVNKTHESLKHPDNLWNTNKQVNNYNHISNLSNDKNDNNIISHIAGGKRPRAVQESNNNINVTVTHKVKSTCKFQKDCCQKCGSADHFTRHCTADSNITNKESKSNNNTTDKEGESNAKQNKHYKQEKDDKSLEQKEIKISKKEEAAMQNIVTVQTKTHFGEQHKHGNSNLTNDNKDNVKVQNVVFVRTSKDQCKYCGSEDHLSRHCPSKGQENQTKANQ